jgi:hypothetical protein
MVFVIQRLTAHDRILLYSVLALVFVIQRLTAHDRILLYSVLAMVFVIQRLTAHDRILLYSVLAMVFVIQRLTAHDRILLYSVLAMVHVLLIFGLRTPLLKHLVFVKVDLHWLRIIYFICRTNSIQTEKQRMLMDWKIKTLQR